MTKTNATVGRITTAGPPRKSDKRHLLVLRVDSTPFSVRAALVRIRKVMEKASVPGADLGRLEIVLAEALNNIVEHGYLFRSDGKIVVRLMQDTQNLTCEITDSGTAMPGETLPVGDHPTNDMCEDLPEGGFGWYMIRQVAEVIRYQRKSGRNYLFIQLALSGEQPSEKMLETTGAELPSSKQSHEDRCSK